MPRSKWNDHLPNPAAVSKLIERYIKIERHVTVEETASRAGYSRTLYYKRIKEPADFTLAELRNFSRVLNIPEQEVITAFAEAIRY